MTNSNETATDDASEYSEELGTDYPRIKYPKEVYDRVCGRLPVKPPVKPPPLAKKRKVEDWLNHVSDSESSQATTLSDVSSRDRKRKKMRPSQTGKTKKIAAPKKKKQPAKKVGRKSKRRKQEVNYVESTAEESSDEMDSDDDESTSSSSEADSTPEKKKTRSVISKTQLVRSVNERESRGRMKKGKEEKTKNGSNAKNIEAIRAKSHPNLNEKKEKKKIDVRSEKRKSSYGKDSSMKEKKIFSAQEVVAIMDKIHPNEKKEKKMELLDGKDSSMKEKQTKVFSAQEVIAIMDKIQPNEKKEKKKMDVESEKKESSDGRDSSMREKKRDSSQEVPRNAKPKDNRSESTVPSTSQPPAGPMPRKSILKKSASSISNASGNSGIPSSLLDLFTDGPTSYSSSSSLAPFKVPKRKDAPDPRKTDTVADRPKKKVAVSPPLAESSEETAEASNGWDPRNTAFVPPARNFGKPHDKAVIGVEERRKSSEGQRPTGAKPSPLLATPSKYRPSLGSNEGKRSQLEEDEGWKKMMTGPQPGILPFDSIISPGELESARAILTAATPSKRSEHKTITRTETAVATPRADPRARQERWNGGGGATSVSPMGQSSKDHFPTPKSAEIRDGYAMVKRGERPESQVKHPSGGWTTSGWTESPSEPTRERRNRWNECTPSSAADSQPLSPPMNSPLSPPHSASSAFGRPSMTLSEPTLIPIGKEEGVRYRFIPIDDECLPRWNKSDRYRPEAPAMHAVSSPVHRCKAIVVAGPFQPTTDKHKFEKMMKDKGADVEWTEAPATKDPAAMEQRSIAAILCYSEDTIKALMDEKTIKVHSDFVQVGVPLEVLVSVDGVTEGFDERELSMEMTDALETYIGALVELLIFAPSSGSGEVEGKARFFYSVHATRAACGAPIPLGGGRSISFAPCPPEKATNWIAEIYRESQSEEDVAKKPACTESMPTTALSAPTDTAAPIYTAPSRRTPLLPTPTGPPLSTSGRVPQPVPPPSLMSPSMSAVPQPVPPPSLMSLSLGRSIKREPSTLPSLSSCSLSSPAMSLESQQSQQWEQSQPPGTSDGVSSYGGSSRFGALPTTIAIPPPGLVDPKQLGLLVGAPDPSLLYAQTIAIPAISVPASLIPLPPPVIPPPTHIVPLLPHPDLPAIQHEFFQAPVPKRADPRRSGGAEQRQPRNVDPATFIKPFKALLPKREPEESMEEEEEELLLYARPVDDQPTDWDAVRNYFRDDDCSSRVYGGVVSLRYTGDRAREKAQVLLVQAPHVVNNQELAIGLTYSVLFSANKAIGKTRLYDELMQKFGAVVEVEKKCDTPTGRPVYKIYFDSVERAQTAAAEGITVGESTLTNIGRVPT